MNYFSPQPRNYAPTKIAFYANQSDPRHGTRNGYGNLGCRCDRCKRANADAQVAYYRRNPEQEEKHRRYSRAQTARKRGFASLEEYEAERLARREARRAVEEQRLLKREANAPYRALRHLVTDRLVRLYRASCDRCEWIGAEEETLIAAKRSIVKHYADEHIA